MSTTRTFREQLLRILTDEVKNHGATHTAELLGISPRRLDSILREESKLTISIVSAMHAAGMLDGLLDSGPNRLGTLFSDPRYSSNAHATPGGYVVLHGETAGGRPVELMLSPGLARAVHTAVNAT